MRNNNTLIGALFVLGAAALTLYIIHAARAIAFYLP